MNVVDIVPLPECNGYVTAINSRTIVNVKLTSQLTISGRVLIFDNLYHFYPIFKLLL